MYRTVMEARSSQREGHVQRRWSHAAADLNPATPGEHKQLVEAVHTTDGISKEQAELQVTAFEQFFMNDARLK